MSLTWGILVIASASFPAIDHLAGSVTYLVTSARIVWLYAPEDPKRSPRSGVSVEPRPTPTRPIFSKGQFGKGALTLLARGGHKCSRSALPSRLEFNAPAICLLEMRNYLRL
jgi:hypothetical protein